MSSTSFGRRDMSPQVLRCLATRRFRRLLRASGARVRWDGAAVAHALRTGDAVDTVFGPVAFDAKGDAEGMTYEMNVWRSGHFEKLP
jgi:ABC-type branched-subunit amino acid transport system substrate-binding protein